MFVELLPILQDRPVTLTIARQPDGKVRVNVVPIRLSEQEPGALSTAISVVGTPEELDQAFPEALTTYSVSYTPLAEQTKAIATEREEAAAAEKKRADEERAKRLEKKASKPTTGPASATTTKAADDKKKNIALPASDDLFATLGSAPAGSATSPPPAVPPHTDTATSATPTPSRGADPEDSGSDHSGEPDDADDVDEREVPALAGPARAPDDEFDHLYDNDLDPALED